jgi:hypothetical protein
MTGRTGALVICAALLAAGASASAAAQDMAETAQINAGVAQQAGAERSLGSAITRSMRGAGDVIATPPGSGAAPAARASRSAAFHQPYAIPAHVDALAGTDAPTYRLLRNGAVFRISWGFRPSANAICIAHCPEAGLR